MFPLCTNLSIQFLLFIIHLLHTLFQTVREQLLRMCFTKRLCIAKGPTRVLGRQCPAAPQQTGARAGRSDVIVIHGLPVDVAVVDEDGDHPLEHALLHLPQLRDLFSYCLHADVRGQLSLSPRCVNSSCGRHIRMKSRVFPMKKFTSKSGLN